MADSESAADTVRDDEGGTREEPRPEAAIRSANAELLERAGDGLKLPISILIEQRDEALRQAELLRSEAQSQRAALMGEQDQFITFLMADHEKKLAGIEQELKDARERLERQDALEPKDGSAPEVARLQELLEAAYSEMDETRTDAARLQGEVDDLVRLRDDVRLEMFAQVEAARDEAFAIQSQLDATNRLLEDARDQARDESFRVIEELDEVRRELDERKSEVVRLRGRLQDLEGARNSIPPPPPGPGLEVERARQDVQNLRKQLIDTKRELSRVSRELELAGARRVSRPDLAPSSEPRHATQPGLGLDLPPDSKHS